MVYYCGLYGANFMETVIIPMALTAIGTMAMLIVVFYMAAQFFRRAEYESYVSIEIYQLFVSLLLFVFVFGTSCFAAEVSTAFAGVDQFEVGRNYLNYISNDIALPAVVQLEALKLFSQFAGSYQLRWGPSVWGVIVPAFPAFVVIERVVEFLLLLISPFAASLIVQMAILEVIRGVALPFVLPAGIVLRVFPPTRNAGAFMIASALAFYIVYPYTYVMHNDVVRTMITQVHSNTGNPEGIIQNSGWDNLGRFVSEGGYFSVTKMLFSPMIMLSYLLLQALFLPALSMTLTVAFIKGTTKFISQKMG